MTEINAVCLEWRHDMFWSGEDDCTLILQQKQQSASFSCRLTVAEAFNKTSHLGQDLMHSVTWSIRLVSSSIKFSDYKTPTQHVPSQCLGDGGASGRMTEGLLQDREQHPCILWSSIITSSLYFVTYGCETQEWHT